MRPNLSYLIMATPRSGSYLLCEALINTNRAGRPTEYFSPFQTRSLLKNWGQPDYATYLGQIIEEGTTPNGVFGAKIIWQFFEDFIDRLRAISGNEKLPTPQLLSTTFPHLSYLWIRRRDKVRQAVSFWKALQNNNWVEFEGTPSLLQKRMPVKDWQQHHAMQEALFDYKAIERLRRLLEEDEVEMQQFFAACGVQPFKIIYEDFVNNYEETILQVLDYLQIPVSEQLVFGERKLKKQADEQSEEWVQRYYAMWQQDDNKQEM